MKAQDILVALKIQSLQDQQAGDAPASWSQRKLAKETGVSLSQVNAALRRLEEVGLLSPSSHKVVRSALLEYLVHALKYVLPVVTGGVVRGMPSGYGADPLRSEFLSSEGDLGPVWPDAKGTVRGVAVKPLCKAAPMAAKRDRRLYEYLVLIDAIRGGRARERSKAVLILAKRLGQ